jgi:hypothetical protein
MINVPALHWFWLASKDARRAANAKRENCPNALACYREIGRDAVIRAKWKLQPPKARRRRD